MGEQRRRKLPFDCIRAVVQSMSCLSFRSTSAGTGLPTSEYVVLGLGIGATARDGSDADSVF